MKERQMVMSKTPWLYMFGLPLSVVLVFSNALSAAIAAEENLIRKNSDAPVAQINSTLSGNIRANIQVDEQQLKRLEKGLRELRFGAGEIISAINDTPSPVLFGSGAGGVAVFLPEGEGQSPEGLSGSDLKASVKKISDGLEEMQTVLHAFQAIDGTTAQTTDKIETMQKHADTAKDSLCQLEALIQKDNLDQKAVYQQAVKLHNLGIVLEQCRHEAIKALKAASGELKQQESVNP